VAKWVAKSREMGWVAKFVERWVAKLVARLLCHLKLSGFESRHASKLINEF
jgi:hypothetical protein